MQHTRGFVFFFTSFFCFYSFFHIEKVIAFYVHINEYTCTNTANDGRFVLILSYFFFYSILSSFSRLFASFYSNASSTLSHPFCVFLPRKSSRLVFLTLSLARSLSLVLSLSHSCSRWCKSWRKRRDSLSMCV